MSIRVVISGQWDVELAAVRACTACSCFEETVLDEQTGGGV